jgi:hypothetical protein
MTNNTLTPPAPALTFERLQEMEPRLRQLAADILARGKCGRRKRTWCANEAWFGYFAYGGNWSAKARLLELVGWERIPDPTNPHDRLLRTSSAYDCAYRALYDSLPNCRRCACL